MLNKFFSKQFLRFLVAGGIAACVNFTVGYSLQGLLPFHGDIVAGHLSGMLVAFFLFEQRVFDQAENSRVKSAPIFVAINGLALIQTWLVYYALHQYFFPGVKFDFHLDVVARAIAIITPIFTSFLEHKYFTFKEAA